MSADELRARFSQIAEAVVPMEDPHGRLMSRRRKQVRARVASLATLTAAVIAGGLAAPTTLLNVASSPPPGPPPGPEIVTTASSLTREEYVDRLIKAPIRGNLASDQDMVASVEKAFTLSKPSEPGAKDPRLVFLNRTDRMLQAVVIYTGGDQPVAVASGAAVNGSVKDLVSERTDYPIPVSPFLVLPIMDFSGKLRSVVGLAPPGCAVEYSTKGGFAADGSWIRVYDPEPTGDYALRSNSIVNELWRVSCGGRIHEVRMADDSLDTAVADINATMLYDRVVRYGGMIPDKARVQWQGKLPGRMVEATLVSSYPLRGPAMLAVGPFLKSVLATDPLEKSSTPTPNATGRDAERSMVALGVTGEGLTVVRIPQRYGDRTVLGDQVFVYTESNADSIDAIDTDKRVVATAPLDGGVAILTFSPGLAYAVQAVSARGTPTVTVRFAEQAKGSQVLGDQLLKDW